MSDIQEQIKIAHKKAKENDKKILLEKELSDSLLLDADEHIQELENRISEAIEYINEMCLCSDGYADYGDDLRPEHIVKILKGSDNNDTR